MSKQIKKQYLAFNQRNKKNVFPFLQKPLLSKWFDKQLDDAIDREDIMYDPEFVIQNIVTDLREYKYNHNIHNVVLGISGGIDSAVTAALFNEAGWHVTGVLMPIKQNPMETQRGLEVVKHLGIKSQTHDLTRAYEAMFDIFKDNAIDPDLGKQTKAAKVRAGNFRARLRMMTLYNIAAQQGGLVASTDNFSELAAGFWTLHGDVGDLAPIQSLSKSWEIPLIAQQLGLPKSVIEANPTDGLGIDAGDEAQFGFSYAQFDLVLFALLSSDLRLDGATDEDKAIVEAVENKIRSTAFKRTNPVNLDHPIHGDWRYENLAKVDNLLITKTKEKIND